MMNRGPYNFGTVGTVGTVGRIGYVGRIRRDEMRIRRRGCKPASCFPFPFIGDMGLPRNSPFRVD
jgi:hypothetical protein